MMKTIKTMALLLGALTLGACDKNAVQSLDGPIASSKVKFFNFGINAPAVNFYANDAKVTAITSATGVEATTGVSFGSVGNGGFYSALEPGSYTFRARIAAATDKDLVIATIPGTLDATKSYSVYMSGFYNATAKTVEGFVVEDAFPATFDFTQALVRFVNASPNSQPQALFLINPTTSVSQAIGGANPSTAYKSATAFTAVPAGVYNLSTFQPGNTTAIFARSTVSFVAGRTYTITARGDATVSTTGTATNRAFLDNTLNR